MKNSLHGYAIKHQTFVVFLLKMSLHLWLEVHSGVLGMKLGRRPQDTCVLGEQQEISSWIVSFLRDLEEMKLSDLPDDFKY